MEGINYAAIAELINFCKTADNLEDFISAEEVEHEYNSPDFNIEQDLRLWEDDQGQLCAVAQCWMPEREETVDAHVWFSIQPNLRGIGIEADIFDWAETRSRVEATMRGLPAKLRAGSRSDQVTRLELLKQQGFTSDREFYRMARSLVDEIPVPQFPEGFTVRPLKAETEVEAWVELFNQSFIDHWNFIPLTVSDRLHWMKDSSYQPDLDLVAVAPDGTLAAFCYNLIHQHENQHLGRLEGWIADLGTRRGFRRLGLGRAMLLSGLHALKAKGMDTAVLGVDSENPSGALKLYQSVGFQLRYSFISFVKDV
jgi:mycothiol synthase